MNKFIFTAAVILCLLFVSCENRAKVYVCENDNCFHLDEYCEELDGCSNGVGIITLDEARKRGFYRCSNCEEFWGFEKVKLMH